MMLKRYLKLAVGIGAFFSSISAFSQGSSCAEMEPICSDTSATFTASVGETAEPGNNYGCLATQPNPSWYYLEIEEPGTIELSLSADSDIDFIIWGPFDDLADATSNCGTLGGASSPIVDCSYSGAAYETPQITDAEVGEVYILLITNYAAIVQDITFGKISGEGETDCGIVVVPPCVSNPGTFNLKKNGAVHPTDEPIYLCEGDRFEILSNDNYTLPNDTIAAPIGDGIYTAQLMWLVYSAPPTSDDPTADPAYLDIIIPSEDLLDTNDTDSPIVGGLGCGTYYFVPVAGDDGIGANNNEEGVNDNGGVTWDKNGNGCYTLGTPIQVTYACPITSVATPNCDGAGFNGVDIALTGGQGNYTLLSTGAGSLLATDIANGGTATVSGLENGDNWQIIVTDEEGCSATFTGFFAAPVINPIVITPAISCPDASVGTVDVTIIDGSGNGPAYSIGLNGTLNAGLNADINGPAGTAVVIMAIDGEGCSTDSVVTVTSTGHFINTSIVSQTDATCFGKNDGAATISANPVDAAGADDGEVVTINWVSPTGTVIPGDETNTSQTDMVAGTWVVVITDNLGCEVSVPITIGSPDELDLFVNTQNEPTCYDYSDGSIDLSVSGGNGGYVFSWKDSDVTTDVLNTIGAGTYTGYVTDAKGCMDSIEVVLGQPDSLWAEFTVKNVLCHGASTGSIVVDNVNNASGPVSYYWNLGGVLPNPPTTSNVASDLPAGTYVITIQDEYCENVYEFTLTENPPIVLTTEIKFPPYCRTLGFQSGNGVIEGFASGGVPEYTYLWTNVETGETHVPTTWGGINPGSYTFYVLDDVGCPADTTIQVDSLNPQAIFSVDSDQLNSDLKGTEIVEATFSNQSINYANPANPLAETVMYWNFDDGQGWILSDDINETFTRSYTGEAIYTVCLATQNKNNCRDTTCKEIQVFALPEFTPVNIFTPNSDNVNDVFTFNQKAKGVQTFNATVVDRWGVVMYEFNSITDGWDGTNKSGRECPDGVYMYSYSIVYTNGTTSEGQGNVQLVRGSE